MADTGQLFSLTRADEELEDLLRQELEQTAQSDRPLGYVDHAPGFPPTSFLSVGDSAEPGPNSVERQMSATSSPKGSEPSLLGSGWSWQTPKDAKGGLDYLLGTNFINDTAENRGLMMGLSKQNSPTKAESDLLSQQSMSLSPTIHEQITEQDQDGQSSTFGSSVDSSEDNWSVSDENQEIMGSQGLGRVIGRGAYGTVYECVWKGISAAIKVIEHDDELGLGSDSLSELSARDAMAGQEPFASDVAFSLDFRDQSLDSHAISFRSTQADQAVLEAAMSSAVHHPNIVQTYHYQTLDADARRPVRETRIVMELCDAGSLEKAVTDGRLAASDGNDIDIEMLCLTLLEVASAMEYLHSMNITHRDLKLANVLLKSAEVTESDRRGVIAKVSDFGFSRLLPEHSPKQGSEQDCTGTITHMAPELLQNRGVSRAADVYSFGILNVQQREGLYLLTSDRICDSVWEALMGETAYDGISKMQVMFGVVSEGLRPLFPTNAPHWYAQIARACWREDPKQRPTFLRIKQKLQRRMIVLQS